MPPDTPPVALRFRVPKPPQPFVGRDAELARMAALVDGGTAVAVAGLAGTGKSALVRAFVHRDEKLAGRAIFVTLAGSSSPMSALGSVARAIAGARKAPAVPIADDADAELLLEASFEMAEQAGCAVIIDELDWLAEYAEPLLLSALQHAGRSTWIGTSRIVYPSTDLQKQTLRLELLPREAMQQLAQAHVVDRTPSELDALVDASRGRPAALFRLAFGAPGESQRSTSLPWADASTEAQRVAETLALFDTSLEATDLSRIHGADCSASVEELFRRGIVTLSPGVELVHSVRALVDPSWIEQAHLPPGRIDQVFEGAGPHTRLALIRRMLQSADTDHAVPLVESAMFGWTASGMARELFESLSARSEPRVRELRIIAADACGDDEALGWAAAEPRPESIRARLAWAACRAYAGEAEAALEEARSALSLARTVEEQSAGALVIARICRVRNIPGAGIAALEAAPPVDDPGEMALRSAWLGVSYALASDPERAQQALDRAERGIRQIPEGQRVLVIGLIASAYNLLGRITRYREVLENARRTAPLIRATPWWARQSAHLALESGELDEALRWADGVTAKKQRLRRFSMMAQMMKLRVHLTRGSVDACRAAQGALVAETDPNESEGAAWAGGLLAYAAIVLGDPEAGGTLASIESTDAPGRINWAVRAMLGRRRGRTVPLSPRGALDRQDGDPIDVRIFELRERAEERMLARDFPAAEAHLGEAQRLARLHGWTLLGADLLALRADVVFSTGTSASGLSAEVAEMMPTPRYRQEAELMRIVSAPVIDGSLVAALAGRDDSPIASRRARAIAFGDVVALDLIDRAFVDEARRRQGEGEGTGDETATLQRAARSIALDKPRMQAVLGGALRVDFAKHAVAWRLLSELVSRDVCTKEELVQAAWSSDYHPLRDDARLRVALGRLRKMLDIPSGLSIEATAEGYRLTGSRNRPGEP